MTPDIDLDALTALEQSIPPAPWRVAPTLPSPSVRTDGGTELVYATWRDSGPAVLKFIADARNNWSALLSALTATRAERDDYQGRHVQAELLLAATEHERDAARAEVRAARKFADDMAGFCSPYGVSVRYAMQLREALDRAAAPKPAPSFALEVPPDCPRDCKTWCKAYEEGAVCPMDVAAPKPDVNRKLDVLCECRDDGQCEHNSVAAAPRPDDERWTWVASCPGCGQAKGHPCIGALGGDGAVHPERRGRAVAFGYGLNAAAGAGDGEQDTATTERVGPMPAGGWPCANCGTRGMDCIDEMNRDASLRRCCGTCGLADAHGDTASVQGAADGEAQASDCRCPDIDVTMPANWRCPVHGAADQDVPA